ncbi:unnamed protein product [Parnassius mnemosyne]|uniref:Uncharacterized protein n=1 Tax=Parnassius mnemosyne TaxID=213953 RepID=A0AAV1M2A8_9NEOP
MAAGLSLLERPRHVRSVCYPDDVTLNIVVIVIGVLAALLALGFIKAVLGLGLRCIASWGLERLLKMPRKLEHYYESSLRYRPVIYDNEGWPVHPDTMKRSVRCISKHMEFILNLIFFITIPCVIVCDALRFLISKCRNSNDTVQTKSKPTDIDKNEYSSQDLQVSNQHSKRRSQKLRKWMQSQADELSTDIWQKGLSIQEATEFNYVSLFKSFVLIVAFVLHCHLV